MNGFALTSDEPERPKAGFGMGGHQGPMLNDEWLTPPELIRALGTFDLDPCSPILRPWDTARHHFSITDDGLSQRWHGRVWLNPPYGNYVGTWLDRMAEHNNGVALIFARTETDAWFQSVWTKAAGILFLRGRLNFHYVGGNRARANAGAPSALVAYGAANVEALIASRICGHLVRP